MSATASSDIAAPDTGGDDLSPPSRRRFRLSYTTQVLVALALGVVLGYLAREAQITWLATTLGTIGSLFVQLLKLAVPPLVFTAVVSSIAHLRGVTNAARLAGKTLVWFAITGLASSLIGLALGLLTHPGRGVSLDLGAAKAPEKAGGWTDFLTGIIPTNPVGAFVQGNVLQIVFLGVVVGLAAVQVGDKAEPFLAVVDAALEITQKALWWVILLAPLGTLGLIGKAVATYGWDLLAPLATFAVDVYVGCFLVLLVLYPAVLMFAAKLNPVRFFAGAWPAIQLAFVSRSSVGTMPLTQEVTVDRLGVPKDYAAFAVPFGATSKMDGCAAIYPALASIFVAEVFGMHLSVPQLALIVLVSVVGSAATAGLTGAIVMLTLTLSTLGLPLAGAGLLLAIDPILDMMRTATNVAGQALVPVVVAAREGLLDREVYDAPKGDLPIHG
ncbi:Proton/glutamate-aspartate symporter [Austwickia sp. TVS 96-490-7B]|uniref:dicarboxylate/amino acid:cation symporter n=1 Tax=Austwickia sp. TVS 96-490-7B TaxID=2830843 RepID=UPI001C570EC8|nr:dicarboxylate/amino acid:cation symporter [Austwickia sp. TVS 96-490-7B]MBW3085329.1 Proton/glutamate-aspartate symporter [Austwickia sp. TVS 96-490-7B]